MSLFDRSQVAAEDLSEGFTLVEVDRDVVWVDDVPLVAVVRLVAVESVR